MQTESGQNIQRAAELLRQGEVVAIPTETVYGLAANALDEQAVAKIFEVKNRPKFDPLIVHVADLEQARQLVREVPRPLELLAQKFWPGPLTLILPKRPVIPDLVSSGLETIGIRVPHHPLAQQLLPAVELPLAAPSANPFGYVSPTRAEHVLAQLEGKISYVLDGGPATVGVESTIVTWRDGKVQVLRLGGIPVEEIEAVVGPVEVQTHSTSNPTAPGQLQSHYAPGPPVTLQPLEEVLQRHKPQEVGLITFQERTTQLPTENQQVLSGNGDMLEAATHIFEALRSFDRPGIRIIVAELLPEHGLGRAVNDRLRRAAAKS